MIDPGSIADTLGDDSVEIDGDTYVIEEGDLSAIISEAGSEDG